jgi:hypothetical protein
MFYGNERERASLNEKTPESVKFGFYEYPGNGLPKQIYQSTHRPREVYFAMAMKWSFQKVPIWWPPQDYCAFGGLWFGTPTVQGKIPQLRNPSIRVRMVHGKWFR